MGVKNAGHRNIENAGGRGGRGGHKDVNLLIVRRIPTARVAKDVSGCKGVRDYLDLGRVPPAASITITGCVNHGVRGLEASRHNPGVGREVLSRHSNQHHQGQLEEEPAMQQRFVWSP